MATYPVLEGKNAVLFERLLENAKKEPAQLIPYQTSLSYDPKRDTDSTTTKMGNVPTASNIETDLEVEFLNAISKAADDIYDSLYFNKKIEVWKVHLDRVRSDGKVYAEYMRGIVSEDSNDNDADDHSTRDATFTIDGVAKRGWTDLPADIKEEIDYVFRDLAKIADGGEGSGEAFKDDDRGIGANEKEEATNLAN